MTYNDASIHAIIVMHHSGDELDNIDLGEDQAGSVIRQVCYSLAKAESIIGFEHRDLYHF